VRFHLFSGVVVVLLGMSAWASAEEIVLVPAVLDQGDAGKGGQPPTTAKSDAPSTPSSSSLDQSVARAPEMLGDKAPTPCLCFARSTNPGTLGSMPNGLLCNGCLIPFQPLGNRFGFGNGSVIGNGQGNRIPATPGTVFFLPGTQTFKVADDNSPRPQDRVFFSFNYFDNLLESSNAALGADIHHLNLYQEYFGIEKTFLDGAASLEIRIPIDTLTASSDSIPAMGGTHTDLGDLTVNGRYAFYRDQAQDNWLTAGFAVTAPTGPNTLGGVALSEPFHSTGLQPWVGALWHFGDWFVQGFSSVAVPIESGDATFWFNDVGVGYRLYSAPDQDALLTAVVPTIEFHVSDPLNHRSGLLSQFDTVDLTLGTGLVFGRSSLALGVALPLTGPRPFDAEAIVQFRVLY
jgi:hypothetical protein